MTIFIRIAFAAFALALAAPAIAQVYGFATLGMANVKTTAGDESGTAYGFGVGYQIGKPFAVESAFTDYGDGTGLSIAAVGNIAITDDISLVGKVGALDLGSKWSGTRAAPATDDLGWTALIGAGVQFKISDTISARAMLETINGKGSLERVDSITGSLIYSF
jgi:hypothetical protein